MADPRISFQSRTISFDFDGVLASLVLGKRWAKTRKKKSPIPLVSAAVRALELGVGSLTERFKKPYPHAAETLERLRTAGLTLYVLTSRADVRIAAAERWLDRRAWRGFFERLYFNVDGEDADAFKEKVLRAHPIDIHVDDDPGTIAHLAPLFPDMLFVHLDHERGRSPRGANIVAVEDWAELAGLIFSRYGA